MTDRAIDAQRSAHLIVRELLALKPTERFAIVADPMSCQEMVQALAGAAASVGADYAILVQPTRPASQKNLLSPAIEAALEHVDVMVGITGSGGAPTYSRTVKRLLDARKIRVSSMVMRDIEIFTRGGAMADYAALMKDGEALAKRWRGGRTMRITSPGGTDISAPIEYEDVIIECGYADKPGMEAAFSDGEVSSRPVEGTAEGIIVVDGPMAVLGTLSAPIHLTVEKGKVVKVAGEGSEAQELQRMLATIPNADNIAEFGIGLNPACRRNGRFEEEKKARGNVHIALGDNIFYGGTVECAVHMDMVVYKPTVTLDGEVLVSAGRVYLDGAAA